MPYTTRMLLVDASVYIFRAFHAAQARLSRRLATRVEDSDLGEKARCLHRRASDTRALCERLGAGLRQRLGVAGTPRASS